MVSGSGCRVELLGLLPSAIYNFRLSSRQLCIRRLPRGNRENDNRGLVLQKGLPHGGVIPCHKKVPFPPCNGLEGFMWRNFGHATLKQLRQQNP